MTVQTLPFDAPDTFREAVADLFKANPLRWIDGTELARIGGCYAWRSRVSDCRRQLGMTIENRQRKDTGADGQRLTRSEYRYVPAQNSPCNSINEA